MSNYRVLLYFTLFFLLYLIWAQWQMDYGPKPEPVSTTDTTAETAAVPAAAEIPQPSITSTETEQAMTPVSATLRSSFKLMIYPPFFYSILIGGHQIP